MEFFDLKPALDWIMAHPHWSGAAVFIISLAESLAIVGLFIPGTIVMFGVGALVATGALSLWATLGFAVAGAVVGDGISYWLGHHYHEQLRVMWPFSRYPQLLARGESFFHRHGGKSVLLGRFVGPVRPIIPVVAGMLGMSPLRFLVVNVLSALGWAPAYILPGMVFGASLGLASAVASRLAVLVVGLLVVLWVSIWGVRAIIRLLQPHAEDMATRVLAWSRAHRVLGGITAALVDPYHPESRGLLIWAGILVLAAWLFLGTLEDVVSGDPLVRIDSIVYHILQGLRTPWADQVMVLFAELGDVPVILSVVLAVFLVLAWQRNWHAVTHWVAAVAFGALLTLSLKQVLHTPRPVSLYQEIAAYGFPSVHVTMAMVIYGFLAVLIARSLSAPYRWVPYAVASALVTAIALSRLYLGAHWLSDVLGGLTLGLAWVVLLGIAYGRHLLRVLPARLLSAVALVTFIVAGSWHVSEWHGQDLGRYAVRHPIQAINAPAWWERAWQDLPAYRIDVQGLLKQPLTVQWAGSLSDIRSHLEAHGWRVPVAISFTSALQWLAPTPELSQLPVLPQVHDGRHEALLLVHPLPANSNQEGKQLVLRLWSADTVLRNGVTQVRIGSQQPDVGAGAPLWVGNVTRQHVGHPLPVITLARSEAEVNVPADQLQAVLEGLAWKLVRRDFSVAATPANWNGDVLLLRQTPAQAPAHHKAENRRRNTEGKSVN